MAHNCIDWTTTPPTRKIPLLILSRGNDHVHSIVPKEFKTLEDIARKEFNLGDVDVKISSSCVNLCNGHPARITESTWEHVSAFIGCATVEAIGPRPVEGGAPREPPPPVENVADEHHAVAQGEPPLNADEPDHSLGDRPNASAEEAVQDEQGAPSDHGADHDRPATPENQPQAEEPWEEEVSAVSPRKMRFHRRVVSENENENEDDESGEGPSQAARSQVPAPVSPPSPRIKVKQERKGDHRSEPEPQPSRLIKQEKRDTGNAGNAGHSQAQSQPSRPQAPADSSDSHKLMIRVAHRPSKQESKFTTKSTTKVHKVLASACKSFGLDATRATLYLIVSMDDDDEGEVENLFPCDRSDTIARAGAERDIESKFLLKIAGEP